ncbi:MAG TPA: DoxX family protein [Gemmatimonadales bacterium]|nr:DoxX family protein [Gemmatimonadales bacterium]
MQLSDVALLLLRIGLGTVFIVHGTAKRRLWKVQPSPQLPVGLLRTLRLLSIAEPAGGLAVLVGFLTQPAALGLALVMLGALRFLIVDAHRAFTTETAAGWEFELVLLFVALALALMGGGGFALDRALFGR